MKLLMFSLGLILLPILSAKNDYTSPFTLPAAEALEGSVYDLSSTWHSQDNQLYQLEDLKGKTRVIAMGYTSCQYACPRIIADLQRIEKALLKSDIPSDDVIFSFISIDPEVDTPEKLKALENNYHMDASRWLLLTGDEDGVLELAVALGMKYRKTSPMDFAHSNIITVLAPDGRIVYQTSTLGEDLSETLNAIQQSQGTRR